MIDVGWLHIWATSTFHDGFVVGALIAAPLTLVLEHYVLRPLVRWHARAARQHRGP